MTNNPICLVGQIAVVGDSILSDKINIIQEVLKAQNTPILVDFYKKKYDASVEVPTKQCGGSGLFIPDPGSDFYPSRIPDLGSRIPDLGSRISDPKTATKERGGKKFVVIPVYCSHKFHKIANYFILLMLKKKIWPI